MVGIKKLAKIDENWQKMMKIRIIKLLKIEESDGKKLTRKWGKKI